MIADGPVLVTGWWLLERERHAVSLNEDIDHLDRNGVVEFRREGLGAGEVGVDLHDQEAIGVVSRSEEFWPRCAVVQCEIDVSIGIRRRALGHHHTRSEHGQDGSELPESAWHVFDAVTLGEQNPLRRAEEAAAVRDAGLGQHVVVVEEEGSAKNEVLPVVP